MFKALLLATWHDLSDVALAEALSDRASFRRFCGFARDEETPERTAFVLLEWSETQTRSQRSASGRAGRRGSRRRSQPFAAPCRKIPARVPLDWAVSTGNQGTALMLLAQRRGDAEMAKVAVQQIKAAFTALRDGGDAHSAGYCEAKLPEASALAKKLAKR